jgi:hypothetical protein
MSAVMMVRPDRLDVDQNAHFADGERRFHAMVSRYFARS